MERYVALYLNYKFVLFLNNTEKINGYITEKIFDFMVVHHQMFLLENILHHLNNYLH